ncbi:MAG: O-antigen ligase family protein [Hoeflea sp.]|uniref:O-antigen ligase family protein n=1 Tax=Hoeflea sp. TaxID=1940281 RepID=UPI0032EE5EAB
MIAALAASLSLPDAYTISSAFFAIIGAVYLKDRLTKREPLFEKYLSGKLCLIFMAYALICASIQFWHEAPLSYYEMYIPFLWAPLIVLAVLVGRIDRRSIWLGCLIGVFFAFLIALYQSVALGIVRSYGFLGSPITFGNNAILLGSVALAGRHDPPFKLRNSTWLMLAYLGFFFGVVASLFSQSKGGWPLIPLVLIWALVEDFFRGSRTSRFALVVTGFLVVCLSSFMPLGAAISRIHSAVVGTVIWFQTGEITEGSAAVRLELWKLGLTIWPEKPLLGHGREGIVQRMHDEIGRNEIDAGIGHITGLHNEPIQLLAEQGLIGLVSWVMIYAASILVFGRTYLRYDGVRKWLGQAGLMTVGASLIFGMSDMNLMLNANRQIFVFLTMALSALVIAENKSRNAIAT